MNLVHTLYVLAEGCRYDPFILAMLHLLSSYNYFVDHIILSLMISSPLVSGQWTVAQEDHLLPVAFLGQWLTTASGSPTQFALCPCSPELDEEGKSTFSAFVNAQ